MQTRLLGKLSILGLLAITTSVQAHTPGLPQMDFVSGFGHPFSGLDHILAMLAVGLWAAQLGGRSLWIVPLTFVFTMSLGGAGGLLGMPLPYVELGIAGSVFILGLLVALSSRLPLAVSMILVGIFAVFHGHAHGTEMALNANAVWYSIGFMLATGILHISGIGIAQTVRQAQSSPWLRAGGTAIALSGLWLLAT